MLEQARMSYHKYGADIRPHYHRSIGKFSLSKISLDDRDLPRKMHNGNRVKAYYAYDVASGALIGAAYSQKKDENLFIECVRDMFRNLERWGLGTPLEMEVENHLVRHFEDGLMKAGEVFPFVRWCAPTNSQEKHAEQFNRAKKYGTEKHTQDNIGRWYSTDNTNNATQGERYYNEATDRYEIRQKTYSYEDLVADDRASIEQYNNGLHRLQKTHAGKSKMEVMLENANPAAPKIERERFAQYIGEHVQTSIRRNQYCTVQYNKYQLPNVEVLRKFAPNNYNVDAYYFENENGEINEVFLYQNGKFLCTAKKIVEFTTARAEWTDADTAAMAEQAKYISHFDKVMREDRHARVKKFAFEPITQAAEIEAVEVEVIDNYELPITSYEKADEYDFEYYSAMAINSL
jgi:hypothetical protein